ncbi:MAG TPA: hypothetical protein VIF62_31695 [Labilithrix sp.]
MSRRTTGLDPERTRLRTTVAALDREIARLTKDGGSQVSGLAAPWADLVGQLALGPEPEVRACPVCQEIGMREATLCAGCWSKLVPPPHDGDADPKH